MQVHRRELPSEYGSTITFLTAAAASPTASATTRFRIPATGKKLLFRRLTATHTTAPISATGTVIATANKVTGTSTRTDLSEPLDLEAIADLKSGSAKFKAGAAPSALIVNPGDGIEVTVVSDAAIGTAQVGGHYTLEFFVLN